ncbi:23S rRNA m methyltransferase [Pseudomonas ficuserectae]|nr:23S rRNA m [Pseudomonas ficuserectae]RMS29868.1 23S rRNA m methyltransferase [Pseudomonas ficuserectae]RMS43649.1 23S rRNA m methyltransferase [Pseudomonas ficuserectae]
MAKHERGLRFQPTGGVKTVQIPAGKKQRLTIERLSDDGRGIAFLDGKTWFVAGSLAGEEVEVRVLNARGKVVEARTERVFTASTMRRAPACEYFGRCGGCSVQHVPHEEQLALKQRMLAEQLLRVANVVPDEWAAPLSGAELAYRRRARVAGRGSLGCQGQKAGRGVPRSRQSGHRQHRTLSGAGTGLATHHE